MNTVKKWTRTGFIFLVIGISLLIGTLYRSNETSSRGFHINFAPNSWAPLESRGKVISKIFCFLWTPREVRLDIIATAPIDVHLLNSKGIKQWEKNQTVKALWEFKETKQETHNLQIPKRGDYAILVYNPTNENVIFEGSIAIYGIEKDLLCTSIIFIITGLLFTTGSRIVTRKKPTNDQGSYLKERGNKE